MNIIEQLEREEVARLAKTIPDFEPGDTLIVNVRVKEGERTRVQAYEGVCIGRQGGGLNESFTVRKISYGEGVERVFPVHSPMIDSIKVARRAPAAPEPVALSVSQRVTIMDLRESMCRWPLGDPTTPEFRFCGARSITGLPYCTHHAEIAYQPAAERKRDRRVASFR